MGLQKLKRMLLSICRPNSMSSYTPINEQEEERRSMKKKKNSNVVGLHYTAKLTIDHANLVVSDDREEKKQQVDYQHRRRRAVSNDYSMIVRKRRRQTIIDETRFAESMKTLGSSTSKLLSNTVKKNKFMYGSMDLFLDRQFIGRGAHGVCYVCLLSTFRVGRLESIDNIDRVVVKQIAIDNYSSNAALNEVKALQSIEKHPNIIAYYGHFIENETLCIVMEYAAGGSLAELLTSLNGKLLDESRILDCFTQIAMALNYLHAKRIMHRDIKPQNILLNRAKTIYKLSDFGISKCLQSASKATSRIGTSNYLSPEICQNRDYDFKSDVWSLGCILYELITLEKAFSSSTLLGIADKIGICKYRPIDDSVSISVELRELLVSLLSMNPRNRPSLPEILIHRAILQYTLRLSLDIGMIDVITDSICESSINCVDDKENDYQQDE